MSIYPSLEDMKVDHLVQAQNEVIGAAVAEIASQQQLYPQTGTPQNSSLPYPIINPTQDSAWAGVSTYGSAGSISGSTSGSNAGAGGFYPGLAGFMGLELSEDVLRANMPEYLPENQVALRQSHQVAPITPSAPGGMVAPISSASPAFSKSQLTHGIRQVVLCKDGDGKVGLRVKAIDKGIFVALVAKGSPAAMGGLKFGDQILQINNETVAGYTADKVNSMFKKLGVNNIVLAVRDRPFERTLTLHKDSTGHLGFQFKDGKITAIVVNSSAAKNGLLIEHNLLELNGQNVVGMKDKDISKIIEENDQVVTVTVIPNFLYRHMMKNMSNSLVKKMMDHSVADM